MADQMKKNLITLKSKISKIYNIGITSNEITPWLIEKIKHLQNEFHQINMELFDYEEDTQDIEIEEQYTEKMKYLTDLISKPETSREKKKNMEQLLSPRMFQGDIMDYANWTKTTLRQIEKENLSEEEKLMALKNTVGGNALDFIKHLSSFVTAKERLEEYYGDSFLITEECFKELEALKLDISNYAEWKKNVCKLENIANIFINVDPDMSQIKLFKKNIARKLPKRMIEDYTLEYEIDSSLNQLIEYLRKQGNVLKHRLELGIYGDSKMEVSNNIKKFTETNPDSGISKKEGIKCSLCGQEHKSIYCQTGSPKERLDKAVKLKLCKVCLSKFHKTEECKSEFRCKKCTKRHTTNLCFAKRQINAVESVEVNEDDEILNC